MHRILAIFLICLLPLQSFAGAGMGVKMAGMVVQMADASKAPCHEASQPMQAASQDCCGSQAMCHFLCQVSAALPMVIGFLNATTSPVLLMPFVASFQSADLGAGFKPPIL